MASLKSIIRSLHREILEAFPEGSTSSGLILEPKRITLNLDLTIPEGLKENDAPPLSFELLARRNGSASPASAPPDGKSGSLTLELEIRRQAAAAAPSEASSATDQKIAKENISLSETDLVATLSQALGPPGFDSSARATVLRETLAELSSEAAETVIASLAGEPCDDADEGIRRAQRQLRRILERGPAGANKGAKALRNVFSSNAVEAILELIQENWKSQEDWMKP